MKVLGALPLAMPRALPLAMPGALPLAMPGALPLAILISPRWGFKT